MELSLKGLKAKIARILIMDNDTQWDSVMAMIEKALEQKLRIDALYRNWRRIP